MKINAMWLSPVRVASLGAVAVGILLFLPISVRSPGDPEAMSSCGNVLELTMERTRLEYPDNYWELTYLSCTSTRITRVAQAVGAVSLTLLGVAFMAAREPRRDVPVTDDGSAGRPG